MFVKLLALEDLLLEKVLLEHLPDKVYTNSPDIYF
jgi:hypothetical protein